MWRSHFMTFFHFLFGAQKGINKLSMKCTSTDLWVRLDMEWSTFKTSFWKAFLRTLVPLLLSVKSQSNFHKVKKHAYFSLRYDLCWIHDIYSNLLSSYAFREQKNDPGVLRFLFSLFIRGFYSVYIRAILG